MQLFSDDQWLYEDTTLTGLDRPGADLAAVEVYGCIVRGAKLGEATLRRWVFEECTFVDCDLSNTTFAECTFQGCRFEGCRLIGVDWRTVASLNFDVRFERCNLSYGLFGAMNLQDLQCLDSECTEADFAQTDLRRACFAGSSLRGAIFASTRLEGADLSRATDDAIDPRENAVAGAQFSTAAAVRLAHLFGITVPPGT